METDLHSDVFFIDPAACDSPVTQEDFLLMLQQYQPQIAGRVRVNQMENSKRIRITAFGEDAQPVEEILRRKVSQFRASGVRGDARDVPDYRFSFPEESYGPTLKILRSADASLTMEHQERLHHVIIHILSSNAVWLEEGKSRAETMLRQICSAHRDAPGILRQAAEKWGQILHESEYTSDEEDAADFRVINSVLSAFNQPIVSPAQKRTS